VSTVHLVKTCRLPLLVAVLLVDSMVTGAELYVCGGSAPIGWSEIVW